MTDTVHPLAARGFEAGADSYERARPDYPADAVAAIVERLGLRPGRTLLELGAGTGKLTRQLVPSGARILALEPVAGMRARLIATVPDPEVLEGTAEDIPLPAASVDAVVVAQAFHWFDAVRALSEIHRVLRPGGSLVLIWNLRDESVRWVRGIRELIDASVGSEAPAWQHGWRDAVDRCALFEPLGQVGFRHAQSLTVDGVLDRVTSISTVAAADPATRARLLADVETMLREDPETAGRDRVELPYATELYWTTTRTPLPAAIGWVASVHVNSGGVPKPPVDGADILRSGLTGDRHAEPKP
ncbi:MAG: class I SAM-dependent methyltransferase, partial [Candidatus Limnocylindrales bacterium]